METITKEQLRELKIKACRAETYVEANALSKRNTVMADRRTKRNKTRSQQNRKAIKDQSY